MQILHDIVEIIQMFYLILWAPQFQSEANDSKFNAGVRTLEMIQVFGMPKVGAKTLCTYGMSYVFLAFSRK